MTVRQCAERLAVSSGTIYGLIAAGRLRCVRIGLRRGVIRIQEEHLAEFLKQSEPVAHQPPAPIPARQVRLKHLDLN